MHGVCSECGLRFTWGSLLNHKLRAASWLFEHVRGVWSTIRASLRNGVSSLRGGRWWRRVRMEHAVRPWRLVAHWLVWMMVAEIGLGAVAAAGGAFWQYGNALTYSRWTMTPFVWTSAFSDAMVNEAWRGFVWPWRGNEYENLDLTDFAVIHTLAGVGMGAALCLLPVTMMRMRVRPAHLLRGVGHAAPVVAVGIIAWLAGDLVLSVNRSGGPNQLGMFGPPDDRLILSLAVWCVMGLWWWRFVREYLRLPRAGWVAVLLFIVALLGAIVLCRPAQFGLAWAWDWVSWHFAELKLKLTW